MFGVPFFRRVTFPSTVSDLVSHTPPVSSSLYYHTHPDLHIVMSIRSSTPPKRRVESPMSIPAKTSKMSASAPVFKPTLPIATPAEPDGAESSTAASRVMRPLPSSRRPGVAANLVPQPAIVPKTNEAKENTRRLIVVLSQVSVVSLLGYLHCSNCACSGVPRGVQSVFGIGGEERCWERGKVCAAELR